MEPKPPLTLQVLNALGKIKQKTTDTLSDLVERDIPLPWLLVNPAKVTEIMRASAIESFSLRIGYYESLPGFYQEWLGDSVYETTASTLESFPLQFVMASGYKEHVPAIRKELETALQALLKLSREAQDKQIGTRVEIGPTQTESPTQSQRTSKVGPDLEERKAAYHAFKRKYKNAGVTMTETKLAKLAHPNWNTRDTVMKWKQGKDRRGDDRLIRQAMEKAPPASQP